MNNKSYNIGFIIEDRVERYDSNLSFIIGNHIELYDGNLLTDSQKNLIDYARSFGCKWMAKDNDDRVFAYRKKPIKGGVKWYLEYCGDDIALIEIPISFIHFDDDEPYCL